jgi:cytosine/adenosine deaminase-related metal-dependent hydrolase
VSILIKGATIIAMDPEHGAEPFGGDILIENDRIARVGGDLDPAGVDEVIDGRDRLVMPGLVNAHLHSWEALFKGRYDNMPLELWMLYSYPILGLKPLPDRLIYLRTMLVAIESLKNGVTCVLDDVLEMPGQSLDQLGQVFRAYEETGIRANCSGHIINKFFTDTVPYANELLPDELKRKVREAPPPSTEQYLDFCREAISRFHGRAGRLRYVIAPSGPQRCTEDLLVAADELSREHGTTYHIHILETKTQAITGREFYGKTLIRYMHDIGVLNERTTIAHSIWVTDEDIGLMADAKCSISHNAISNQKLGAGIAPFRKLVDAGVNVALGTDGISSNDTPRIFDVMHVAALLHKVTTPDYTKWPNASEILRCATIGGARSAFVHDETGSLEPGKKADMLVLKLKSLNFTPLNDVRNHLVYCENGNSIERVIVNGEVVVQDGRMTKVDEEALLEELRGYMPEFQAQHARVEQINAEFEPYFAEIHRRCCAQPLPINRYSGDEREWVREEVLA